MMLTLDSESKWITFDCYGTLVQWHQALRGGVRAILQDHFKIGDLDGESVRKIVDDLRLLSMEQQQRGQYRDYKSILRSSLAEVLIQNGFPSRPRDAEALLSSLQAIQPHPEVPAALERLRARFRLAIISNTDDDLIANTISEIGVPIDVVVTAQQARAYKPDHRLFRYAHAVIGVTPEETVHVGMGQVSDLKVCNELGIRAVWINRMGEVLEPEWAPVAILPDLSFLPDLLTSSPESSPSRKGGLHGSE